MPQHWPATVVLALVTALTTTMTLDLFVKPWIERRNRRLQAARASRDTLSDNMLLIMSAGARVREFDLPSGASETVRERLREERERWYGQIEEATRLMVDTVHTYGLTYRGWGGYRDLLMRYAITARMIILSERNKQRKAELLVELTGGAWTLFFGERWWNPRALLRRVHLRSELTTQLDVVAGPSPIEPEPSPAVEA